MHSRLAILFGISLAATLAACNADNANSAFVGTVKGTIKSSLGGAIVNARIRLTPSGDSTLATVHSGNDGSWHVDNVPVGSGSVLIDSLPADCDTQPTITYFVGSPGTTTTLTLTAHCTTSHQIVSGTDFDGGAIDDVRRRWVSQWHNAWSTRDEDGVARGGDAPGRMRHVILDGGAVALARIAPVALRHERRL